MWVQLYVSIVAEVFHGVSKEGVAESCAEGFAEIICYMPSAVCYPLCVVCHLSYFICHMLYDLTYRLYAKCFLLYVLSNML